MQGYVPSGARAVKAGSPRTLLSRHTGSGASEVPDGDGEPSPALLVPSVTAAWSRKVENECRH
jgi:hypothetical protein